jgi:hypothetical protein
MKARQKLIGGLIVGTVLFLNRNVMFAQPLPPGDGGGTNGPGGGDYAPNTNRNIVKFQYQTFAIVDTNDLSTTDTNMYAAFASFPDPGTTEPIIKARFSSRPAILIILRKLVTWPCWFVIRWKPQRGKTLISWDRLMLRTDG